MSQDLSKKPARIIEVTNLNDSDFVRVTFQFQCPDPESARDFSNLFVPYMWQGPLSVAITIEVDR